VNIARPATQMRAFSRLPCFRGSGGGCPRKQQSRQRCGTGGLALSLPLCVAIDAIMRGTLSGVWPEKIWGH
jgi:hypothetical protein